MSRSKGGSPQCRRLDRTLFFFSSHAAPPLRLLLRALWIHLQTFRSHCLIIFILAHLKLAMLANDAQCSQLLAIARKSPFGVYVGRFVSKTCPNVAAPSLK